MSWFVGAETSTIFSTERAGRARLDGLARPFQNGGAEGDVYLGGNVGVAALGEGRCGEQHQGGAGQGGRLHHHVGDARGQAHHGRRDQHPTDGGAASPRSTEGRLPGHSWQLQFGDETGRGRASSAPDQGSRRNAYAEARRIPTRDRVDLGSMRRSRRAPSGSTSVPACGLAPTCQESVARALRPDRPGRRGPGATTAAMERPRRRRRCRRPSGGVRASPASPNGGASSECSGAGSRRAPRSRSAPAARRRRRSGCVVRACVFQRKGPPDSDWLTPPISTVLWAAVERNHSRHAGSPW